MCFRECRDGGGGLEKKGDEARCKVDVEIDAGEMNWTLTAANGIGKVELVDSADLNKRGTSFKKWAVYAVKYLFGARYEKQQGEVNTYLILLLLHNTLINYNYFSIPEAVHLCTHLTVYSSFVSAGSCLNTDLAPCSHDSTLLIEKHLQLAKVSEYYLVVVCFLLYTLFVQFGIQPGQITLTHRNCLLKCLLNVCYHYIQLTVLFLLFQCTCSLQRQWWLQILMPEMSRCSGSGRCITTVIST